MRSQIAFDLLKISKDWEVFKAIKLKFKLCANFRFINVFSEASKSIKT